MPSALGWSRVHVLILKLILVPALIGGITLAGRRWGPAVAGWLSGFPVVTGPILFFIAIEQGPRFGSAAAAGALAGGVAWVAFALGYAWACTKMPWLAALLAALAGWLVAGILLVETAPAFAWIVAMIVVAVVFVPFLFPRTGQPSARATTSNGELLVRMASGGLMTFVVTLLSPMLGPDFTGLIAVFPVMGIVLAAFSHRASGHVFTIYLLRGMVAGFYAFTSFCLTVSLALPRLGVAAGFALALVFSLAVHCCTLLYMRHRSRVPARA